MFSALNADSFILLGLIYFRTFNWKITDSISNSLLFGAEPDICWNKLMITLNINFEISSLARKMRSYGIPSSSSEGWGAFKVHSSNFNCKRTYLPKFLFLPLPFFICRLLVYRRTIYCKWIYKRSHIWTAEKVVKTW